MVVLRGWLWVLGFLWGAIAFAGPSISKEEAARRYAEADQSYKLQEFEKALEQFGELYRATQEPVLLFNIAQCQRQLGHLEEAVKSYQFFLRDAPKDSPARQNAESRIKELETEIQKKKDEEAATQEASSQKAKQNPAKSFFIGAVTAGVISASLGTSALSLARKPLPENIDDLDQVIAFNQQQKTATRLAIASDVALSAAIISAGIALWQHKHQQKKEAQEASTKTTKAVSVQ